MVAPNTSTKFTSLQLKLPRLFGREVPDEDLIAVKDMIGKYFPGKLQEKVDAGAKEKRFTQQNFDAWLNDFR